MLIEKDTNAPSFMYRLVDFTGELWHQVQIKHRFIPLDRQDFMLWHFLSTSLEKLFSLNDLILLFG